MIMHGCESNVARLLDFFQEKSDVSEKTLKF